MRVHRLNCATFCPVGRRLINGEGSAFEAGRLACLCLLLETRAGLALVDTGLGTRDVADAARTTGVLWRALMRPRLELEETAYARLRGMRIDPADVRHIVLTHLDFDHAGGLADFPGADVHLSTVEHQVTRRRLGPWARRRYVPAQWAHRPRWVLHAPAGERWMGFDAVQALPGTDEQVLLIPLPGHSVGHCGVAVRQDDGRWLLHAGDAYFHHNELERGLMSAPLGVRLYRNVYQARRAPRIANAQRLAELRRERGPELTIIASHDPIYLPAEQRAEAERPRRSPSAAATPA